MHAAGQIIHLYLAQRWYQITHYTETNFCQSFAIGTLFSDIRYLIPTINRQQTHSKASLDRVYLYSERALKGNSYYAFVAGMVFHSFIDYLREGFVVKNKVYDLLKSKGALEKEIETFLKRIEDELFFDMTARDATIINLREISAEEIYCVQQHVQSTEILIKWHENLVRFLTNKVSELFAGCVSEKTSIYKHIPCELQVIWSELLPQLLHDPEVVELVTKTFTDVENFLLVEQYKSQSGSINEKEIYR